VLDRGPRGPQVADRGTDERIGDRRTNEPLSHHVGEDGEPTACVPRLGHALSSSPSGHTSPSRGRPLSSSSAGIPERTARRVVELCIRDLKDQALAHFPSGKFTANAAWTVIACLAHNLLRWTSVLGLPGRTIRAARTLRRRLLALPGRLTRTARRWTLHLPTRWPWRDAFAEALARIRALAPAA
jgi:hypothetical protein